MKKTIVWGTCALVGVMVLSGCMGQPQELTNPPAVQRQPRQQTQQKQPTTDQPVAAETQAPKQTNDLPTALDETDKDLQVIDTDLKQIDQLNVDESDESLE